MTLLESVALDIGYTILEKANVEDYIGAGFTDDEAQTIKEIYADLQIKLGA